MTAPPVAAGAGSAAGASATTGSGSGSAGAGSAAGFAAALASARATLYQIQNSKLVTYFLMKNSPRMPKFISAHLAFQPFSALSQPYPFELSRRRH